MPEPETTIQDLALEAIHQETAELVDVLRRRAATLNLEVRIRDQQIATQQGVIESLEAQVANLQTHLNDTLAEDGTSEQGSDAGSLGT